jgi:hypothetical protein
VETRTHLKKRPTPLFNGGRIPKSQMSRKNLTIKK